MDSVDKHEQSPVLPDKYEQHFQEQIAKLKTFAAKIRAGEITEANEDDFIDPLARASADQQRQIDELMFDSLLEGFLTRRPFYQHLDQIVRNLNTTGLKERRPGQPFQGVVYLLIDADNLKAANDESGGGHPFGDEVLKHIGRAIRKFVRRREDFYGRLETEPKEESEGETGRPGGDEMSAFLYDTDRFGAMKVAEAIRQELMDTSIQTPNGQNWNQTVSVGIVLIEPGMTIEEIIEGADIATYKAKQQGRNQSVVWTKGMARE